ncbi:hypothetical protein AGMMS49592_3660 [Endomicrobiia bacterium]|nr:hypothetical protein AGMMS49592_3660 [Endomicrobiia bacterium]
MILNVREPKISKNFTMDDIRKIRDWQYEVLKKATPKEIMDYYNTPENLQYVGKSK